MARSSSWWILHGKHAYFSSDQSNSQFMAMSLPFLSLMMKLRNSELQQPRRLRQIERQVKKNICSVVAMLRLLLFACILSLANYAKIGLVGVTLIQLIKDSLLGVHVVVKTINLEILGCLTTSKNTTVPKYDRCFLKHLIISNWFLLPVGSSGTRSDYKFGNFTLSFGRLRQRLLQ